MVSEIDKLSEATSMLIKAFDSASYTFQEFSSTLLSLHDSHKCPICKGKQIYYMDTWLCPKCDWQVIMELKFDRDDVKKIRGEDYYNRKKC